MAINLENIIIRCLIPERTGQKELYDYTYKNLVTAVALYTKDATDRDWVFNLGMLRIFNSLENYQKGTNYLGWARTILVRSAIDHIRKNKTYHDNIAPVEIEDDSISLVSVNDALNTLENEDLIRIIQSLPDNERMIFSMYEIEGYTHKEIEKLTGVKNNTSKWLLSKARKKLKELATKSIHLNENNHGK